MASFRPWASLLQLVLLKKHVNSHAHLCICCNITNVSSVTLAAGPDVFIPATVLYRYKKAILRASHSPWCLNHRALRKRDATSDAVCWTADIWPSVDGGRWAQGQKKVGTEVIGGKGVWWNWFGAAMLTFVILEGTTFSGTWGNGFELSVCLHGLQHHSHQRLRDTDKTGRGKRQRHFMLLWEQVLTWRALEIVSCLQWPCNRKQKKKKAQIH